MKQRLPLSAFQELWQQGLKTYHSRLVVVGVLIGVVFLPFWLYDVIAGTLHGAASLLLVSAFALGLYQLWSQRHLLKQMKASHDDRWLGHMIILAGIGAAPFCAFAEWSQKLIWLMILFGIAVSSWGFAFFGRYSAAVFMIVLGMFPQPTTVGKAVWEMFTPPEILERSMTWSGVLGLKAIGQTAVAEWTLISFPRIDSSVRVDWGCSGYDMACIIGVASLLMAIYFKQSFWKTVGITLISMAMALVANVPRIMLMAMANAYWGQASFEFWHGFWGGQIFLGLLFTVHYYVVMAIVKQGPKARGI